MTDLRIRITESDGVEYAGTSADRHMVAILRGRNAREGLAAMLEGMQNFAAIDCAALVAALDFCPEFCQLAAAVHGLHLAESNETPTTEAIAILTKLCDSRQPEAIRTRAGNLLIDIAEDDRAVCDVSSVDDRPGQDAGQALVGAECWMWNDTEGVNKGKKNAQIGVVMSYGPVKAFDGTEELLWGGQALYEHPDFYADHARPAYLGKPTT